jgi:ActR/RegA family two-component response regulator
VHISELNYQKELKMSKKDKALRVLIIDDDKEYVEALDRTARQETFRIILDHAENLEDGIALMEGKSVKAYSGIILDVKCLTHRNQEMPHHSFLPRALDELGKIAPQLPKVALTGESERIEEYKSLYLGTLGVYLKGSDEVNEMFQYLRDEGNKLEDNKIKQSYPEVFAVFEREYLDANVEQELISCIKNMGNGDFTQVKDNLARLRRLQEQIYIELNRKDKNLVPVEFMQDNYGGNKVQTLKVIQHLRNNKFVEPYCIIDKFANTTYDVASANGSHSPYSGPDEQIFYKPTKYTVQALTFGAMDLLLWYKKVRESMDKEK